MIFHFVKIMDVLKLLHQKTPKIKFDALIVLRQFLKYDTKIWRVKRSKNVKLLEFQKVEICQDNEFLRRFPIVLIFFGVFSQEIQGVRTRKT